MTYQFNLREMHPVYKLELVEKLGLRFRYAGEAPELPPMQKRESEDPTQQWEPVMRPLLDDSKTIGIFHVDEDECFKHFNRRISTSGRYLSGGAGKALS